MLNFFLGDCSCDRNAERQERSYCDALSQGICSFLRADHGVVAALFALVIFLGVFFVSVALDYGRYVAGKEKIRSLMDQAAAHGAGSCRLEFLRRMGNDRNSFDLALESAINYAKNDVANHLQQEESLSFKGAGISIDYGQKKSSAQRIVTARGASNVVGILAGGIVPPGGAPPPGVVVTPLLKPNGPNHNQDYCSVAITYNALVKTTLVGFLGMKEWKIPGKVVAVGALNNDVGVNLDVDFLVDVSSSMSTIANPGDRDLMMAITTSEENVDSTIPNGCIFVCHLRNALLPGPMSRRLISFVNGSLSSATQSVKYQTQWGYFGGTSTATLNKGAGSLRTFKNKAPSSNCNTFGSGGGVCTNTDEQLVMLDDALKYFNIRLKSDELFDNVKLLVGSLMRTEGDSSDIKLAFHRFSGPYEGAYEWGISNSIVKTFLPSTPNLNSNALIKLSELQLTDLKFSDFDYAVPNITGDVEIARLFPKDLNGDYAVYAPRSGSSSDSVKLAALSNDQRSTVLPDRSRPSTHFPEAMQEMIAKMRSRPPSANHTARALVMITDGIQNLGTSGIQTSGAVSLLDPKSCTDLKADKVIILVVHSYYRFQPGHGASRDLYHLAGGTTSMLRSNIDQEERLVNEREIKSKLVECASPNLNPQPGQNSKYYFSASDSKELKEAFEMLLQSLLHLSKSGSPVLVTH